MKYLLVLLVILVVAWRWRTSRSATFSDKAQKAHKASTNATPIPMLQCAHCGTHLPEQDAIAGRKGHYCSVQHRAIQEP